MACIRRWIQFRRLPRGSSRLFRPKPSHKHSGAGLRCRHNPISPQNGNGIIAVTPSLGCKTVGLARAVACFVCQDLREASITTVRPRPRSVFLRMAIPTPPSTCCTAQEFILSPGRSDIPASRLSAPSLPRQSISHRRPAHATAAVTGSHGPVRCRRTLRRASPQASPPRNAAELSSRRITAATTGDPSGGSAPPRTSPGLEARVPNALHGRVSNILSAPIGVAEVIEPKSQPALRSLPRGSDFPLQVCPSRSSRQESDGLPCGNRSPHPPRRWRAVHSGPWRLGAREDAAGSRPRRFLPTEPGIPVCFRSTRSRTPPPFAPPTTGGTQTVPSRLSREGRFWRYAQARIQSDRSKAIVGPRRSLLPRKVSPRFRARR